jgi:tetratricopeptide (TPR) repeat protein
MDFNERAMLARASQLARAGHGAEAEALVRGLLIRNPKSIEAHAFLAARAFEQRHHREAVSEFKICVELNPQVVAFHFNLGLARETVGDLAGAVDAYLNALRLNTRDWRVALFAGAALEAAGRREEAAVVFSLGDDADPAMRAAKDQPQLDPEIRRRSSIADRVMREQFTRLHAIAVDDFAELAAKNREPKPELSRVRNAIWTQTHDGPVVFRTPAQEPSIFYMPDLEARTITPRELLPWAEALEAATSWIRAEYLAAVQAGAQMSPYVDANTRAPDWQQLRGNTEWSALHLFKGAEAMPFVRLFPRTLKALEAADIVRVSGGKPIEMFFSRLKPGTHIPPHFGAANNRLTVHLPLIVPEGCTIRVGNDLHEWREGEIFAFDDSFEHEAWNRSNAERVVLIFESHHPDLRPEERAAVEHAFETRGRWLKARRLPMSSAAFAIQLRS